MILFFGTRPGKKTSKLLHGVSCSHCQQKNTITAVEQANYIHLFWLPLIKIGTSRYAECSHCKRYFDKQDFNAAMERAILSDNG